MPLTQTNLSFTDPVNKAYNTLTSFVIIILLANFLYQL